MSVQHVCNNNPKAVKGKTLLVEGYVDDCKYHGRKLPKKQAKVKGIR